MKRLAIVLFCATPLLAGLIVRADATPADPWEAFRRGNELLRQVRQAGDKVDPGLLAQAEQQYRACLSREAATSNAGALFDAARHNLELTKLLRAQLAHKETNTGAGSPQAQAGDKSSSKDGQSSPKNDQRGEAKKAREKPSGGEESSSSSSPEGGDKQSGGAEQPKKQGADSKAGEEKKDGGASSGSKGGQQPQDAGGTNPGQKQGDSSPKGKPGPGKEADPNPNQPGSGKPGDGKPAAKGAPRPGPGSAPGQGESGANEGGSDGKRSGQKGGRGQTPGPGGTRAPDADDLKPSASELPGHGPGGDRNSGGHSKTRRPEPEVDPAKQVAIMRLQEAIRRIQNNRARRVPGPGPGREDPANLTRYRDW